MHGARHSASSRRDSIKLLITQKPFNLPYRNFDYTFVGQRCKNGVNNFRFSLGRFFNISICLRKRHIICINNKNYEFFYIYMWNSYIHLHRVNISHFEIKYSTNSQQLPKVEFSWFWNFKKSEFVNDTYHIGMKEHVSIKNALRTGKKMCQPKKIFSGKKFVEWPIYRVRHLKY